MKKKQAAFVHTQRKKGEKKETRTYVYSLLGSMYKTFTRIILLTGICKTGCCCIPRGSWSWTPACKPGPASSAPAGSAAGGSGSSPARSRRVCSRPVRSVLFGFVRFRPVSFGSVPCGVVLFGFIRFRSVPFRVVWFCLVSFGFVRFRSFSFVFVFLLLRSVPFRFFASKPKT